MSNNRTTWLRRILATICLLAATVCTHQANAQSGQWRTPQPSAPNAQFGGWTNALNAAPASQSANPPRRAPLAWLIQNPDQTDGAPPYALTDQTGTVQRYVEPEPGIDLASHVGQLVSVRNDTGNTLLASQLDLPRQRLMPMVGDPNAVKLASYTSAAPGRPTRGEIEQAQYVDNESDSVRLLPDEGAVTTGPPIGPGNVPPLQILGMGPDGYPGQSGMCGPGCGPESCDSMQCGPGMMQPFGPCPQCGGYHDGPCRTAACDTNLAAADTQSHVYGDVDFKFMRTRFSEDTVGKLSETYELAPRFILGVRNLGAVDGRIRFWDYDRATEILGGGAVRVKLDVFDLEAVHRFEGRRSTLDVAAGLRFADLKLTDPAGARSGTDAVGLTVAADGLTACHCLQNGYCAWAYGGRVSLLSGNWTGDDTSVFVDHPVADDNILVTELYAGAQIGRRCGNVDVHGRVVFEIQNWRSDVLAQDANLQSLGFLGPALQIGAEF
jgi:hypothetical protein